jgi:hypothetical protein
MGVMATWAERQAKAELHGACPYCRGPLEAGECADCRVRRRDEQDDRRDAYAQEQRCRCGQPAAPYRKQCASCLKWDRERERWRLRQEEQRVMDQPRRKRT